MDSLQKIICQGEGSDISLLDRLPEKVNGQEQALNRIFLDEMLGKLEAQERLLIYMRYYRDMTQTEIGEKMGDFPGAGVQNGKEDPSKAEKGIWVKIRSWDTGGSVFQLLVCL